MRELVPSDIITEKLSRDGNLKVTEVEVEDGLESMSADTHKQHILIHKNMLCCAVLCCFLPLL